MAQIAYAKIKIVTQDAATYKAIINLIKTHALYRSFSKNKIDATTTTCKATFKISLKEAFHKQLPNEQTLQALSAKADIELFSYQFDDYAQEHLLFSGGKCVLDEQRYWFYLEKVEFEEMIQYSEYQEAFAVLNDRFGYGITPQNWQSFYQGKTVIQEGGFSDENLEFPFSI